MAKSHSVKLSLDSSNLRRSEHPHSSALSAPKTLSWVWASLPTSSCTDSLLPSLIHFLDCVVGPLKTTPASTRRKGASQSPSKCLGGQCFHFCYCASRRRIPPTCYLNSRHTSLLDFPSAVQASDDSFNITLFLVPSLFPSLIISPYGLLTSDQVNSANDGCGFDESKENGNARTSNMSCSVKGFSSPLAYVDKHSLHLGQRHPNMETLMATLSVKGKGPAVPVSSETFLKQKRCSRNSGSNHEEQHSSSRSSVPLHPTNAKLDRMHYSMARNLSRLHLALLYPLKEHSHCRGQSSLQLEPKSNALEI